MKLLDAIRPTPKAVAHSPRADWFKYNGLEYFAGSLTGSSPNLADSSFRSMVEKIHNENGPVSSAVAARMLLLSQVQFAWEDDRPNAYGDLSRTGGLDVLQRPGNMTRAELLARLELDASYAGNAFLARRRGERVTYRLDPSRVTFAFGSNSDPTFDQDDNMLLPYDATVIAIAYDKSPPGLTANATDLEIFRPGEFAHWKPEPDPVHWWRGQSWIVPLITEVGLDGQVTDHQAKYFKNAATPNLVLLFDPSKDAEEIRKYKEVFNDEYEGTGNAYKNWFLGGGVTVEAIGADLSELSLKDLQGGLETRIAMRSRVPAVILGAREGLSGSSLNTGNYSAARRLFADGWFTPTVSSLCEALESLVPPPPNKRLTHDPSKILFLQEDRKDEAEINSTKASAIRTLTDGGYDAVSVVQAIAPEWSSRLEHTGLLPVQVQPPGSGQTPDSEARTVMGRLGRMTEQTGPNYDRLSEGLSAATLRTVKAVWSGDYPDMETLRASMVEAFKNGAT